MFLSSPWYDKKQSYLIAYYYTQLSQASHRRNLDTA